MIPLRCLRTVCVWLTSCPLPFSLTLVIGMELDNDQDTGSLVSWWSNWQGRNGLIDGLMDGKNICVWRLVKEVRKEVGLNSIINRIGISKLAVWFMAVGWMDGLMDWMTDWSEDTTAWHGFYLFCFCLLSSLTTYLPTYLPDHLLTYLPTYLTSVLSNCIPQ